MHEPPSFAAWFCEFVVVVVAGSAFLVFAPPAGGLLTTPVAIVFPLVHDPLQIRSSAHEILLDHRCVRRDRVEANSPGEMRERVLRVGLYERSMANVCDD